VVYRNTKTVVSVVQAGKVEKEMNLFIVKRFIGCRVF